MNFVAVGVRDGYLRLRLQNAGGSDADVIIFLERFTN
jgi:hypothetical protein